MPSECRTPGAVTATVVPFPATRRRDLVASIARRALELSPAAGEQHIRRSHELQATVSPGCHRNTFIGVHCEVNGIGNNWVVAGDNNVFIACAGAGTTAGQYLSGSYNKFIAYNFQSMGIQPGAAENDFDRSTVLTAFTDGGTRTSHDAIAGTSPKMFRRCPLTICAAVGASAGGVAGQGLMMSSTTNLGVFFGVGSPTLAAAQGSICIRTDGSTVNNRLYINTTGSNTWTAVTTAA